MRNMIISDIINALNILVIVDLFLIIGIKCADGVKEKSYAF